MIQRIQTIWLMISAISSGLMLNGGITTFISAGGQKYITGLTGIFKVADSGNVLIKTSASLSAIIILITLISVISILMFKRRRIQKILSLVIFSLSICLLILMVYFSYIILKTYNTQLVPGYKMFLPVIIPIAAIFAYRGISTDDQLLKSYERLR